MNWTRGAALGVMLLAIAVNTWLLIQLQSRHQILQKEIAELNRLSDDVTRKSAELIAESDRLKAMADRLKGCTGNLPHSNANQKPTVATSECALIHKPKAGCPQGYVQEKHPRFTEQDGSREFACESGDPAKKPCIDELRPGERIQFQVVIPIEPEQAEPASQGPKT
jgi:hypothetical protein